MLCTIHCCHETSEIKLAIGTLTVHRWKIIQWFFVTEHLFLETLMIMWLSLIPAFQVLKSVWLLLSENVALALSLLYAFLQLLFSGGSTLLNLVHKNMYMYP